MAWVFGGHYRNRWEGDPITTSKLPQRTPATALSLTLSLPADVTAPAFARRAIRGALAALGPGSPLDDVLLVTSELVTNALEHGERPDRLELEVEAGHLVLRVFDADPTAPELRTPSPAEARSRGLQLVQALAASWGYQCCATGKYVWATFPLPVVPQAR